MRYIRSNGFCKYIRLGGYTCSTGVCNTCCDKQCPYSKKNNPKHELGGGGCLRIYSDFVSND